jgi:hypothetical protein
LYCEVVPHFQAVRDGFGEPTEVSPHALTDRLQRLKPGGARMGVDADAFGRAMIDRDEHAACPSPVKVAVRSVAATCRLS